jgi:hypothetical protein
MSLLKSQNESHHKKLSKKVILAEKDKKTNPIYSFKDEVVQFNFMIPSYRQRKMLFEKIQYLVDKNIEFKKRIVPSSIA